MPPIVLPPGPPGPPPPPQAPGMPVGSSAAAYAGSAPLAPGQPEGGAHARASGASSDQKQYDMPSIFAPAPPVAMPGGAHPLTGPMFGQPPVLASAPQASTLQAEMQALLPSAEGSLLHHAQQARHLLQMGGAPGWDQVPAPGVQGLGSDGPSPHPGWRGRGGPRGGRGFRGGHGRGAWPARQPLPVSPHATGAAAHRLQWTAEQPQRTEDDESGAVQGDAHQGPDGSQSAAAKAGPSSQAVAPVPSQPSSIPARRPGPLRHNKWVRQEAAGGGVSKEMHDAEQERARKVRLP